MALLGRGDMLPDFQSKFEENIVMTTERHRSRTTETEHFLSKTAHIRVVIMC